MLLSTIFDALTYGQLKQLSIGGADDEGIYPTYSTEVLVHLNMGLTSLYSKFPIQEKQLTIRVQTDKILYAIDVTKTVSAGNPDPYIIDTAEDPFLGDILRINTVFNDAGKELGINDQGGELTIFLPSYNTIQIPYIEDVLDYYFIYRAQPTTIVIPDGDSPADVDVPIPPILLDPLLTFIASKAQNAHGGKDGKQEGAFLMQQYDKLCTDIELRNIFNNSFSSSNSKVELNGWA